MCISKRRTFLLSLIMFCEQECLNRKLIILHCKHNLFIMHRLYHLCILHNLNRTCVIGIVFLAAYSKCGSLYFELPVMNVIFFVKQNTFSLKLRSHMRLLAARIGILPFFFLKWRKKRNKSNWMQAALERINGRAWYGMEWKMIFHIPCWQFFSIPY